jgi:signal transduction histidine kinase
MFSFFTLFYFPQQQGRILINNYNAEIQNLANTVALGVKIAITEQNFEGVGTAIEFVKGDPRLQFVSLLQYDSIWDPAHKNFKVKKTILSTFPEKETLNPDMVSNDAVIVKRSPFTTAATSGAILLGFSTRDIVKSKQKIKLTSLVVSGIVFLIGILIGFWLARNISIPVLALRDAAIRVGEGDLTQKVIRIRHDEIGQLGKAFNKMVGDLSKTRKELNEKNIALSDANSTLNKTLLELKNTHAQLLQSEKMASLGELTAGIAHEIQNPLNFVNNFSDVNTELIAEMKDEIDAGNMQEVKAIAEDIAANERKINHHGKRADAIVKGMLQHSRTSSGTKESTDINKLADEYLRLAYHGLRAKDKSFNATLTTNYDRSIGNINIIPQDIGRVILNLITNAFYAVAQKDKQNTGGYKPAVSVSTKKAGDKVQVIVADNGNGIPLKIIDKVFQPFFTTKPAGQGTGLGLSLAYDIVKAHGGELKVETKEGEGAVFNIVLSTKD